MAAHKENVARTVDAIEAAIVAAATAQTCGEANPVRLESLRLSLRDLRAIAIDLFNEGD